MSDEEQVEQTVAAAAAAAESFGGMRPSERARLLRDGAAALDEAADTLVPLAISESHLPEGRLRGELKRTTFQLRLFAEVLEDGSYQETIIDHADPEWGMGPRPDLRRMLLPLGPAVVFGASNFPFAFSVAGGDTASALAAGCPVVVKAHPGHPELSERTAAVLSEALPAGVLGLVSGLEAGKQLVTDSRIKVGAFTGSVNAGRALFDLASGRPDPIPFYAELGSLNPVFVTEAAARERKDEIASGFVQSYTLGVGQFCTKPGLLFVPEGSGLPEAIQQAASEVGSGPMLHEGIADAFRSGIQRLAATPGVDQPVSGEGSGLDQSPSLFVTSYQEFRAQAETLLTECFGPSSVVVTYSDTEQLLDAARTLEGNLTATVHGEAEDHGSVAPLLDVLRDRAGRLLWNGWPTGVSVTYAMHHGGPWPATTASIHTSVGTTAIRRFLRPVSYQNMPNELLPEALRD